MSTGTPVSRARARVRSEREAVDETIEAFDAFVRRVEDLPADPTGSASTGATATAGVVDRGHSAAGDRCRAVRSAFAETVRPHSVADADGEESLLETIRGEFTDSIAVALAPATDATFTADLKRVLVSEARSRRRETRTLKLALDREEERLETAAERTEAVAEWIAAAGIRHRDLVSYLYRDLSVDHPVLSTVARLDATCADCQRTIRDHLVRRV
ncbi:DUF7260 family protein [Halobaculum sp. EA56]|uniref:DUF7260 family protein n=1 Tax=Halobaculum sp. EA56 TaxID=3421648 RepID=UPI003EBB9210